MRPKEVENTTSRFFWCSLRVREHSIKFKRVRWKVSHPFIIFGSQNIMDAGEDNAVQVPHADLEAEQERGAQLARMQLDLTHTSASRRKIR